MREAQPYKIVANEIETAVGRTERAMQISNVIAHLEGVQLDRKQKFGVATIGGAMDVYDSAFDKFDITKSYLNGQSILDVVAGRNEDTSNLTDPLCKALILARDNLTPEALNALKELTKAQIDSIQQRKGLKDHEILRNITQRKGANTALLFALEVSPAMDTKRQKCYEELGYLMQLVDDFNDKEIDTQEGITTLGNTIAQPEILQEIRNQNKKVRDMFASQYEPYKLKEMFNYIDRLLAAIGILN